MHTCSHTLVDVHSDADTEESRHLSSFIHVNMKTDITGFRQSSRPHFPLSPSPTILLIDTVVIFQAVVVRTTHLLPNISLLTPNPQRHRQNPFWYCEDRLGISAQKCARVCVGVSTPFVTPALFPLSVCQLSVFAGWQERRRDNCSLHTQRPSPAKSGMKSFL